MNIKYDTKSKVSMLFKKPKGRFDVLNMCECVIFSSECRRLHIACVHVYTQEVWTTLTSTARVFHAKSE